MQVVCLGVIKRKTLMLFKTGKGYEGNQMCAIPRFTLLHVEHSCCENYVNQN